MRFVVRVACLFTAVASSLAAIAPAVAADERTIRGRLVDKACYEKNPQNTGQKHMRRPIDECATACARYGLPLAVLASDGKLYQVVGELTHKRQEQLLPYVTQVVEVTGDVTTDPDGTLKIAAKTIRK